MKLKAQFANNDATEVAEELVLTKKGTCTREKRDYYRERIYDYRRNDDGGSTRKSS